MGKKEILFNIWVKRYAQNKKHFNKLRTFLARNNHHVVNFHKENNLRKIGAFKTANEKLFALFINCLAASPENKLDKSAQAAESFLKCTSQFTGKIIISFYDFIQSFNSNLNTSDDFFNHIRLSHEFPNLSFKKAALFMTQLQSIQTTKYPLFNDISSKMITCPIPVDIVIGECIFKLMKFKDRKNKIDARHGEAFNIWAKDTWGEIDYILFEDIWFWGYFGTRVKNKKRRFELNKEKILTNPWIYPGSIIQLQPQIRRFCDIINAQ